MLGSDDGNIPASFVPQQNFQLPDCLRHAGLFRCTPAVRIGMDCINVEIFGHSSLEKFFRVFQKVVFPCSRRTENSGFVGKTVQRGSSDSRFRRKFAQALAGNFQIFDEIRRRAGIIGRGFPKHFINSFRIFRIVSGDRFGKSIHIKRKPSFALLRQNSPRTNGAPAWRICGAGRNFPSVRMAVVGTDAGTVKIGCPGPLISPFAYRNVRPGIFRELFVFRLRLAVCVGILFRKITA